MMAIVTTGNGGYEVLEYRQVPIPQPGAGEVLLQVLAAGVNNTEINTRLGWYSSTVTESTDSASSHMLSESTLSEPIQSETAQSETTQSETTQSDTTQTEAMQIADGGWNEATPFPLIQGTDCCGRVVCVGADTDVDVVAGTDHSLIGKRVLVRACMRPNGYEVFDNIWMASDFDGAFAQYVVVPLAEVFAVDCDWSDSELATIPCAYGTAENMLHRAGVSRGQHVLVAGASGGVGSAAVQLAVRRGARVTAICSDAKADSVRAIGAHVTLDRDSNIVEKLGENVVDVVIDNVAGDGFANMLKVLRRGGQYVSSGAIAGPVVSLDLRDMYLKDITLIGCTAWDKDVFENVVSYIEHGQIQPLLAKVFPLSQIAEAQREFMQKNHFGNFVLVPPPVDS